MFGLFEKKRVYLDHASATPVFRNAARAAARAAQLYGNPGAIHAEAVAAKKSLQGSRERVAHELGCKARDIIFTSGLTEANNLAILGLARSIEKSKGNPLHTQGLPLDGTHWIVSAIEHASVLECFSEVERLGGKVTHVDPDERGIISAGKVALALRKETVLVSVGWGNNEIGVVQPLREMARVIREHEQQYSIAVAFHSDAGQAPLYISPQVHTLGIDMLALGSGKLYGPRGIGALYLSNRAQIAPIVMGGGQERGLRAGTEDPAFAAGFAEAFATVGRERNSESKRLKKLRDDFAASLRSSLPAGRQGFGGQARNLEVIINGDLKHSLPHMLNVSIPNINAEYLVLALDQKGIAISTKSACNEGENSSHVVAALGGSHWRAQNTLRFSLGRSTTAAGLDFVLAKLIESVNI